MNTNQLKRFATDARAKLRAGVASKIKSLGFDADGQLMPSAKPPVPMVGGCIWNEQILPLSFAKQWEALRIRIERKGLREVTEEAAYTWFNRLMAIRILTMNNITEPVLRFVDEARTPKIVDDARQGRIIDMPVEQRERLETLFKDATRINEQFALLLAEFCHHTPILQACFGGMDDYTEILLPSNILDKNGFVDMLNSADFISDEDYKSPELIGWLYQFYISDRKDEVFAKKGKVEADEIPAATQIFTPNWIVKYMVQNAVLPQVRFNRLPDEDKKYLVSDELPEEPKKPKDLKVADLACGSGHILNECFDILYDLYIASGYDRRDAIENIFAKNLLGIDIDERARQLSTFALMLKACQKDETFADAHALPQVLGMPDCSEAQAEQFLKDSDITGEALKELREAFDLMKDAFSLGSIMKFDISGSTRVVLQQTLKYWQTMASLPESIGASLPAVRLILALTDSYDAIVMNPPYMGGGKMDNVLAKYVKEYYPDSKADLMTVFMEVAMRLTCKHGYWSMINLPSWLFLSTFSTLRTKLLSYGNIDSLLHMGRGIFGIDWGSTAFTIHAETNFSAGSFYRLHKRNFQHIYEHHIKELFLNSLNNKSFCFDFDSYRDDSSEIKDKLIVDNPNGEKIYYLAEQTNFKSLPGSPIAYWLTDQVLKIFKNSQRIDELFDVKTGLSPGETDRFIRCWHEVDFSRINKCATLLDDQIWIPITRGEYRRWYGNNWSIINWKNNGREIRSHKGASIRNEAFYLREGIVWPDVNSTQNLSARYTPSGFIYQDVASGIFSNDRDQLMCVLALMNSKFVNGCTKILNPTIHFKPGNVSSLPFRTIDCKKLVEDNISISKADWDAHETSWDFQENELIALSKDGLGISTSWIGNPDNIISKAGYLDLLFQEYEAKWNEKFLKLHTNEEELNRKFIEIYGLQEELTPDVPLNEVTILQQGEISIEKEDAITDDGNHILMIDGMNPIIVNVPKEKIVWHYDVIIKQLISYIVGCYMGRYRLDKQGLAIAHPNPTDDELAEYNFNITGDETFTIDSDAIIPLLPLNAPFYDNLYNYVSEFVKKVWGEETHTENMNYIERCLGKPLNDYLLKDFWKDHKKMYQNRPIYWLFSSKKGAFRAIVYVHRMHAYTVEQVRSRYLLKYMDWLRSEISKLEQREADLTTQERRSLDRLRSDLAECDEYHERLQVVAEQAISFDLDDGIVKNHALFGDILTKLK